ncbi:heterokaryon incompatibility protein-domain-containing protein [Aspergillus pseudonomiae]|nr:heterokaryon incompatibility protein-domain-containing protein [Aspergillus pseudonomiae]
MDGPHHPIYEQNMESFKHEPLDLDGPAFRLVRLCHGHGPRIDCELFQAWLYPEQSPISYEALSYTWGSTEIVRTVRMNGKRHGITHNLYNALQYLRFRDEDRILWVDGICIDQTNDKERGHQVRHMGDIYKQAERVIFWLGEPTDATNVILNSLRQLQKKSTEHASKTWELSDWRWVGLWSAVQSGLQARYPDLQLQQRQGFMQLLSRPWFKRVWILQEVANARAGLVCCGEASVSAHIFPLAPLLLEMCPRAHCQAVLDIMPGPSRSGTWWNMNRDLYTLLIKFCESQAGLPCDKIYALLGLSSDAQDTDMIRPDYEKSEHDLIRDVVRFLFDDHIYCTQKSYFPTLRKLVNNLGLLNQLFLQHHMSSSNLEELENILERRYFGIEKTDIVPAVRASIMAMGDFHQGIPRTSDGVAMDATEIWDHLKSLLLLLQPRGYNIEGVQELLLRTLSRNYDRPHILNTLLQRRASEITIAHTVSLAMPRRQFYFLQAEHDLFPQQRKETWITNSVLITAASNIRYGLELMKLLIQHRGNEIRVTEGVLIAPVSNKCYALDLVQLLLQQGNKVQITDAVLRKARQNVLAQQPKAAMVMKLLLEQHDNQIT